ncbi:MAG TPA: hypothetical protein VET88_13325, partial [Gammaproteobacteria bacterium]|nr:hypothetical protein [Gammaproteobacteria bacterium]
NGQVLHRGTGACAVGHAGAERMIAAAGTHISNPALTPARPVKLSEFQAGYVLGCNFIGKVATELDDA